MRIWTSSSGRTRTGRYFPISSSSSTNTIRDGDARGVPMASATYRADVVIAGGGLAGIVTACELLSFGQRVLIVDKDKRDNFGGLAKESSGGVLLIGTPHQRRLGIRDSPELAWRDWQSVADYDASDSWPRKWGEFFCESSLEAVFSFLSAHKVRFLPVVAWPERGIYSPGNTVPRWHMVWGLGPELVARLVEPLQSHSSLKNLEMLFDTEVSGIEMSGGRASGIYGRSVDGQREIRVDAPTVVIASGGICGGDLTKVRAHWHGPWGPAPETLLNGAHTHGDGALHDAVAELGGAVRNLDRHW